MSDAGQTTQQPPVDFAALRAAENRAIEAVQAEYHRLMDRADLEPERLGDESPTHFVARRFVEKTLVEFCDNGYYHLTPRSGQEATDAFDAPTTPTTQRKLGSRDPQPNVTARYLGPPTDAESHAAGDALRCALTASAQRPVVDTPDEIARVTVEAFLQARRESADEPRPDVTNALASRTDQEEERP